MASPARRLRRFLGDQHRAQAIGYAGGRSSCAPGGVIDSNSVALIRPIRCGRLSLQATGHAGGPWVILMRTVCFMDCDGPHMFLCGQCQLKPERKRSMGTCSS